MSDKLFWEYQILDPTGQWQFPSASGQRPHHYPSREEALRILRIIHPGEQARLVSFEEITVPGKED
jgi:hypothetical protein